MQRFELSLRTLDSSSILYPFTKFNVVEVREYREVLRKARVVEVQFKDTVSLERWMKTCGTGGQFLVSSHPAEMLYLSLSCDTMWTPAVAKAITESRGVWQPHPKMSTSSAPLSKMIKDEAQFPAIQFHLWKLFLHGLLQRCRFI